VLLSNVAVDLQCLWSQTFQKLARSTKDCICKITTWNINNGTLNEAGQSVLSSKQTILSNVKVILWFVFNHGIVNEDNDNATMVPFLTESQTRRSCAPTET